MSGALRIALIASNRFPISEPFAGGLEAHVWHLARALTGLGHRVTLFAAAGSDPALGCEGLQVRTLAVSRAAQRDPSMPASTFMADHHAYLAAMLELASGGKFDIVHNHSLHYLPIAMAPMLPLPMLTTVHTPPTPWLESALKATDRGGMRLVAVSGHAATSWRDIADDIDVVPNGIDTSRWPLGPGGRYLVWSGRMTAEKAPHLAIAAAQRAGIPLVLAGPISAPRYFDRQVAPRLDDSISYCGHLRQHELAQLVGGAAAALVTPAWDEPYGLVVAEAMACGTPVVAFARGGIPELLSPDTGRLVPAGSVTAMAEALGDACGLNRKKIRAHAVKRCSLRSMVTQYLRLYHEMLYTSGAKTA